MRSRRLLSLLGVLLAARAGGASTVVFQDGVSPTTAYAGTRDVILYAEDTLFWDRTRSYLWPELHVDGNPAQESVLLAFDVSAIPPGSTVSAVTLTVEVTQASAYGFKLYECLRPWVLGQANWTQYAAGLNWQTAGGQGASDRGATALGTFGPWATGTRTVALNATAVALVQRWVDTPATNYGLMINDFGSPDGLSWYSSHDGTPSRRPRLNVTYNGGTVLSFQQGALPTPAYAGARDQGIGSGPDPFVYNFNAATSLDLSGGGSREGAMISWDVSAIPPWSTVSAAAILATINGNGTPNASVPAYALLRPWVETQASWGRYDNTNAWATPGAQSPLDRGTTAVATALNSTAGTQTWPMTSAGVALVQDWVSGATPNYGIVFQEYVAPYFMSFEKRENATPSRRPGLSVTYTEGRLVFSPASGTVTAGAVSAPLTVRRESLGGAAVATGAPAQSVTITSDSPTLELAATAAGPWSTSYATQIPAGSAATAPFVFRDSAAGARTLSTAGTALWNGGSSAWTVAPVGSPLALSPQAPSVAPQEGLTFSASGGTPGYTFALTANGSGAALGPSGDYVAGATPNSSDVVEVTDGAGAKATATVMVGPGPEVLPNEAVRLRVACGAAEGAGASLLGLLLLAALPTLSRARSPTRRRAPRSR